MRQYAKTASPGIANQRRILREYAMPFPAGTVVGSFEKLSAAKRIMEWEDDGGAYKADLIGRRSADMRVVDGMICVAVGEPVVVVEVSPQSVKDGKRTARGKGIQFYSDIVVGKVLPYSSKLCAEGEHLWQTIAALLWTIEHLRFVLSHDDEACVRLDDVFVDTPENHATEALASAAEAVLSKLRAVTKDELAFGDFLRLFEIRRQLEEDLAAWQGRKYSEDVFSLMALPKPAARWTISQILSRTALQEAATTLHLTTELLEREHGLGNRLVRYTGRSPMVVVITPGMDVKCIYGRYGRIVELDDMALKGFLAQNRTRQANDGDDDAQLLADIQFD